MSSPTRALRGNPTATLIAVSFGLFMVGLDATVVSIANPAISAGLGTSFAELQWITNVYLLGLAVFLILGGKIGDKFGRRRTYIAGVIAFALTSVAIGLVGTATGVIVFRALQGASAAMLMPQTLALLRATFPREKFGMAVGIWGGVSSVAIAAGPIVGGALVAGLGWESIFYINAPIAVIGVAVSALVLRESVAEHSTGRFDVAGVVLLALGLAAILVGIVQAESWGWGSAATIGAFVAGLALLAAFVGVEARVEHPLLPLSLFRSPGFSVGGLAIGTNFFTLLGVTFFLTLYLMNLRGYEGLQTGIMLLPLSGVSIIASPLGAVAVSRIGTRLTMALGMGLITVSFLALLTTGIDSPYWAMAVAFVILSFGVGFTMTSAADSIVGSAPVHLAGVAGGFQATMLQLGGALGTAVFAAVVSSSVSSAAPGLGLDETAADGLAQGIVPGDLSAADAVVAQDAFLDGFHSALVVGAVVAAIVCVLALTVIRSQRRPSVATVLEETVEAEAAHA
ncbi:MFS transporter [Demequina sp. NBRC 110057]|uniref:MFS transporter n=1 Tax=Demequina sp. NBRC 110057 TaxID=1570346 RepID=UPI000A062C48|nr:MFS transporter [Demequina sp. NBRC 110057]